MESIWRLCALTILLPLSLAISPFPDNVTITIEPADTIMEGGTFRLCTDFDENITFSYSISPSTGLDRATGTVPAGNCSMDITVADNCSPSSGVVLSVTVTATVNGSQAQEIVNVTVSDDDAAVNATLSRTTADAIEGEDVEVCVTIPSPACENIVFNFSFAGTASDSDYTASNTMNISMGDNQACITIRTMEDGMDEPNESLIITWQPTTLSYVGFDGGNQVTVTIRQRPNVTFVQPTYSFNEGSNMQTVSVMLNTALGAGRNAAINVEYTGDDSRFSLQTNSSTFSDGETSVQVTVIIGDDNVVQMNVSIMLSITVASGLVQLGSQTTTILTITDIDTATISIPASRTYDETDNMLCLQSSIGIIGGINVMFTVTDGSAKENTDFMTSPSPVMIQSNAISQFCVNISVSDDAIIEPDEMFSINWSLTENFNNRVSLSNSVTDITITDRDSGVVSVPESRSFSKTSADRNICVTVPALGLQPDGTSYQLDYSITAGSQGDFSVSPSVLNISSNSESMFCITLNIIDDSLVEGNETFTVTWTLGSGVPSRLTLSRNTTTITIQDNDVAVVGFDPVAYTVMEGQSVDVMVKVISGELQTTISVTARTGSVSVTGVTPINQTIQFSNANLMRTVPVSTEDDEFFTGNRLFTLVLSSSDSLVQIVNGTASINITEDDMPPTVPTPSPSPSPSDATSGGLTTPVLIGIIVGGVALAILALFIVILCVCIARLRVNRQGFYFTNEDKSQAPQMLRYSASLRSISSQTVMPIDGRDKENEYMV